MRAVPDFVAACAMTMQVVGENDTASGATVHEVIPDAGVLNAQGSGHLHLLVPDNKLAVLVGQQGTIARTSGVGLLSCR